MYNIEVGSHADNQPVEWAEVMKFTWLKEFWRNTRKFLRQLNLSQRFMLASLITLLAGMIGIGLWVESQIITGVIHRAGATTALYVESFVAPNLQELGQSEEILPEHWLALQNLLQDTPLGQQIVAFKVWNTRGKLLYSTDITSVGKSYPMSDGLLRARLGTVVSEISALDEAENTVLDKQYDRLLETYSPVWLSGTDQIIAVAEFYHQTTDMDKEIAVLVRRSWFVVGVIIFLIYLLLAGFIRNASHTISKQQNELNLKLDQLTVLLNQNAALHDQVKKASASVALLNEDYLKRIGAELHDGPAQNLGLSILKIDALIGKIEKGLTSSESLKMSQELNGIELNMQNALKEMRGIASGLSLPQLNRLDLVETIAHAVHTHEQQTGSQVKLMINVGTDVASLPVRITIYRLIQEALHNSFLHAGGKGVQVNVEQQGEYLSVDISDEGSGFNVDQTLQKSTRLGLSGMRERVKSLGGVFSIKSSQENGTIVHVRIPLLVEGD